MQWVKLALVLMVAGDVARGATGYSVGGLDDGIGNSYNSASAINNSGDVTGIAFDPSTSMTDVLLWHGGVPAVLAQGVYASGNATGMNSNGDVVGSVARIVNGADGDNGIEGDGFIYRNGETRIYASHAPGGFFPTGLNDAGLLVGYTASGAAVEINGQVQDLSGIGGYSSYAAAINNSGRAVGEVMTRPNWEEWRAFVWDGGIMTILPSFGGTFDQVYALNQAGTVVGTSARADGSSRAFAWWNGVMAELSTPADAKDSVARAINSTGHVVGSVRWADGEGYAALWDESGLVDLNDLISGDRGWHLDTANGINDIGQIVGTGTYDGHTRAFVLTPDGMSAAVPEPTACPLASVAIIGTMLRRRRYSVDAA